MKDAKVGAVLVETRNAELLITITCREGWQWDEAQAELWRRVDTNSRNGFDRKEETEHARDG